MKSIFTWILLAALAATILSGCTMFGRKEQRRSAAVNDNADQLAEHSRALTTGVVDTLGLAPTNRFVDLAIDLAKHDQQIEGLPITRIPVADLLAGSKAAFQDLQKRYGEQNKLLQQNAELQSKLRDTEEKLIAMGKLYEAERNKKIWRRTWGWLTATFGFAGAVAICIFFPAVIPIAIQFVGWIVAKIPALAGALGVVPKQAFDSLVVGVQKIRKAAEDRNNASIDEINAELEKATDAAHRKLIKHRKLKLAIS
jgi:hypothetical protein